MGAIAQCSSKGLWLATTRVLVQALGPALHANMLKGETIFEISPLLVNGLIIDRLAYRKSARQFFYYKP
jgi:hypothetical protein